MAWAFLGPTVGAAISCKVGTLIWGFHSPLESPAFLSAIRGMSVALGPLPRPL